MSRTLYYRHSGKAPAPGVLGMFGAGLAAAVLGAFAYVQLIELIPLIYCNVLITLGYGAVVGLAVAAACKAGKVRNVPSCALAGTFSGLVAVYMQWAYFLAVKTPEIWGSVDMGTLSLTGHFLAAPGEMWEMAQAINPVGLWTIKKTVVKGVWLWLIWGGEAAGILGVTLLLSGLYTRDPYSETQGRWMDEKKLPAKLAAVADPKALTATLERGDYSPLFGLGLSEGAESFSRLTLYTCPGDADAWISLSNVRLVQKKKETKEESESVFKYLHIPASKAEELVDSLREAPAPSAGEAESRNPA